MPPSAVICQYANYADRYFGGNPINGGTSGLPNFTAGGGFNDYYAVVGATEQELAGECMRPLIFDCRHPRRHLNRRPAGDSTQ